MPAKNQDSLAIASPQPSRSLSLGDVWNSVGQLKEMAEKFYGDHSHEGFADLFDAHIQASNIRDLADQLAAEYHALHSALAPTRG